MKRFAVVVIGGVLAAVLTAGAVAAEPSGGCALGEVPPSTGEGVGVDVNGSLLSVFSVRVCYEGTTVPADVPEPLNRTDEITGSVSFKVSPTGALFVIAVDGDSTNSETAPCADGYLAVRGDPSGVSFYGDPDGDFTESSQAKPPSQVAQEFAEGCL